MKASRPADHQDLYYWTCVGEDDCTDFSYYPFNLGKNVGSPFGVLGNREYLTVIADHFRRV
jgi:hypothetical protein